MRITVAACAMNESSIHVDKGGIILPFLLREACMRTKKELIDTLAERTQQPKSVTEKFIDALGPAIQEALAKGEDVTLPGVGKLAVKERAAREGRNPQTGQTITISARKVPAFTALKALKDAVG